MSGINKHSFPGLILGIAFGFAISGVVHAGQVTNPDFVSGNQLDAAHMNNIKSAVNNNDTRLGTAETNITNLQTGTGACTKNAADDTGGMVRVGPLCVDVHQARVSFAGCSLNGTNCTNPAVSTAALSAATSMSWAQAARACANAGKRLLTSAEWMTAKTTGVTSLGSDLAEFVADMYAYDPDVGTTSARAYGSAYIRNSSGVSDYVLSGINQPYNTATDTSFGFRCAR